jgi:hypothetical protein
MPLSITMMLDITQKLLGRHEFGRDDYSLNIINLSQMEEEADLDTEEQEMLNNNSLSTINKNLEQTLFN